MGCARKYVALFNHQGGSPITSLQYFAGSFEWPPWNCNLNYWRYLAARVRKMESQWRAQANFASSNRCRKQQKRNNVEPFPERSFLTHDDHLLHNVSDSVLWRSGDRHQFGMNDFLRRNPHSS